MESTIFFGNGFNRLSKEQPSWDDLLREMTTMRLTSGIPNTMKYEVIISQIPHSERASFIRHLFMGDRSSRTMETAIKEKLAQRMGVMPSNPFYDLLLKMPVRNFITTNYDNVLIRNNEGMSVKKYRQETLYSIRRHYDFLDGRLTRTLWPIHGCYESPKSIMLGLDHYCGSIGKINDYVKGNAVIHGSHIKTIEERLRVGIESPISWIDLLFNTDVHIIGFGLPYEEIDIWWLLDRRMRLSRKEGDRLIRNKIYYYVTAATSKDFTADMRQCLQAYGVEIVEPQTYSKNFGAQFKYLLKVMKQNIETRRRQ